MAQLTPMNPDEAVEEKVAEPQDATANNPLGRPDVEVAEKAAKTESKGKK